MDERDFAAMSNKRLNKILKEVLANERALSREDIIFLLSLSEKEDLEDLYEAAYAVKTRYVGKKVYFRGIIEFSNVCRKNCYYCGIRKDNRNLTRYSMSVDEMLESARWAYEAGYGSVVLQSGERENRTFTKFIETAVKGIKRVSSGKLGITLSLGEQNEDTYKRWFDAGAHRYLLRIETSSEPLYSSLHPADHSFPERLKCLETLNALGYQTGTGVMIGLPGQTVENLADDILFFKRMDVAMIGMGPYLPHQDTPLYSGYTDTFPFDGTKDDLLTLSLKMIATTRLYLKDVNIASTTALQAIAPTGREMGLLAGANIIMPNITEVQYRSLYQLYDNKPCINENSDTCVSCLSNRINSIGETIGYNEWGDSPHIRREHFNANS
jgi:biotin synthase